MWSSKKLCSKIKTWKTLEVYKYQVKKVHTYPTSFFHKSIYSVTKKKKQHARVPEDSDVVAPGVASVKGEA